MADFFPGLERVRIVEGIKNFYIDNSRGRRAGEEVPEEGFRWHPVARIKGTLAEIGNRGVV